MAYRDVAKGKAYYSAWKKRNPEKVREYAKRSYRKHIEASRARGRRYGQRRMELQDDAVRFLGGKCVRCNIEDIRVLTINHINGNGAEDRKANGKDAIYRAIVQGLRKDVEVRCFNCNRIHAMETGLFAKNKPTRI